ncbi:unnamed protein product [Durusdinium trenchii]|uniref:Uncharacterized protein n=1 Tax=Durusdinium trenchii TaxID=1381693 RepID=A0ABP0LQ55_9DINO
MLHVQLKRSTGRTAVLAQSFAPVLSVCGHPKNCFAHGPECAVMGKKPATQKMSLADLNAKFGGNMAEQQLPSQSVGKDFGKAKGKGFRDIDGAQEANDWRSSGPRKGKGKGDSEPSRADTGDWRGGGGGPREDRGGGGGGGFQRREREDNTQAGKDEDWRGSMGRREDNDRDDRRGGGDRFGRGGFGDRDRDRDRGWTP